MIQAIIFDLDGTLVQTERLKALSYAQAAVELNPAMDEDSLVEAFKEVVGRSRREVATYLLDRFELEQAAGRRMGEFGVSTPWQAYVQIRLQFYEELLADPETLREHRWPHMLELLETSRAAQCKIGLATMSRCSHAMRVLDVLELQEAFDFVATRDDVERGKPDPEIYHLVARELDAAASKCLVVEDSSTGVEAALNAGMHVVALATPFTSGPLHQLDRLPDAHIVHSPDELASVVRHVAAHIR